MSLTYSSTGQYFLTYDKYFMMLQNACIRYDTTLNQKPSITSRAAYQHELDDDPSIHHKEDDYLDEDIAPDGIDTSSDDIYNVHNTNFERSPNVKSLMLRTQTGKPKSKKAIPPKPRYNGPVYLPKHIYNMLSEDIKKEPDKYNQEKKAQYKPTCPRMAKVHEQDHEEMTILTTLNLTWKTTSMKNHILCKTQTLRIFWKHMANTLQTWHPLITSQSILLPLMGLQ